MNFPTKLLSLLDSYLPKEEWKETEASLEISCGDLSSSLQKDLSSISSTSCDCTIEVELEPNTGDYKPISDPDVVGTNRVITIKKPFNEGHVFYFLCKTAAERVRYICDKWEYARAIWIGDITCPCDTLHAPIRPWHDEWLNEWEHLQITPVVDVISPARIVRVGNGTTCPLQASSWILRDTDSSDEKFKKYFLPIMSNHLARTLAQEVWVEESQVHLELRGARRRKIPLGKMSGYDDTLYKHISDAAQWIFVDGAEVDVRHGLLVAELSREWEGETWFEGLSKRLDHALSNARTAFNMHIHDVSRDALHQMAELRKAVSDDMQNMSLHANRLLSSLWRDAAIAFGFVLLRIKVINLPGYISFIVATYLFLSIALSSYNFLGALNSISVYRDAFRGKLYGFINDEDFDRLYDNPMKNVKRRSWVILAVLWLIYIVLILLIFPSLIQEVESLKQVCLIKTVYLWHPFGVNHI